MYKVPISPIFHLMETEGLMHISDLFLLSSLLMDKNAIILLYTLKSTTQKPLVSLPQWSRSSKEEAM